MSDSEMTRRRFTLTVAVTAAVTPLLARAAEEAESSSGAVDVGTPADYGRDGVNDMWAKTKKFLIVRENKRIVAVSSVCTHKKCILHLKDSQIACKCHGSRFSWQGKPEKGPAKMALAHLAIALKDGRIVVDPSQQFSEDAWNDPASFVAIEE